MKNMKLYLLLVIEFLMVFTACNKDEKEIPVKIRAYNNKGAVPFDNVSNNTRTIANVASTSSHESFADYNTFYSNLGNHVRDITPGKFILATAGILLYSSNGEMMNVGQGLYDFAKGITITAGDIPVDVTCSAMNFSFATGGIAIEGGDSGCSIVEFPWPSQLNSYNLETLAGGFYNTGMPPTPSIPPIPGFTPSLTGGKATILMQFIVPDSVFQTLLDMPGPKLNHLNQIVYGAGVTRLYNGIVPINEIIPGLNSLYGGVQIGSEYDGNKDSTIVVPFTPIKVPASAASVTFHISWNLDGIISQYTGNDGIADTDDDIFILKNGWWNGLQISANIQ